MLNPARSFRLSITLVLSLMKGSSEILQPADTLGNTPQRECLSNLAEPS